MTFLIMEDQLLFTIRTIRAYHFRMISYRATLTNRTGLGPKEGEVSVVHLHRDPFFSDWKVQFHSSPDRFTGQRSLGESTSGEFVDKSTGQLCSTGPGGPEQQTPDRLTGPLSTVRDWTGQKSPTKSTRPDWTELGVNLQTSPPDTGQVSYLPVKGR